MPLNAQLALAVQATLTGSPSELADSINALNKTYSTVLTSGVAAGNADVCWHDQRTIAPSSNDDLDLAGVLTGLVGGTATFVKVKAIIVFAATGNTNNVVMSGAATNGFTAVLNSTGTAQIRPGACLAVFAGVGDSNAYAVVAGTGDILRLTNGGAGTSVTYDIIVIGTSA